MENIKNHDTWRDNSKGIRVTYSNELFGNQKEGRFFVYKHGDCINSF